jgi:cysteinyl-tRNA synthetase
LLKALAATLGFLQQPPKAWLQGGATAGGADENARIEAAVAARAAAKAAKHFAEADRIRRELLEQGVVLKDGPGGTTWERA